MNGIQTVLPDFKEADGQICEYVISPLIALDGNNPELKQVADSSNELYSSEPEISDDFCRYQTA